MQLYRPIIKIFIAGFCVWHMAALGIYSLNATEGYPILEWIYAKRMYIRPYTLMTSQWQMWKVFSPDPRRLVDEMEFDKLENGQWKTVKIIDEKHLGFFQRGPEFAILRRMIADKKEPLREHYVYDICREQGIPAGTPMRIRKRWHVIPKNEKMQTREWWNNWEPDWKERLDLETTCPSAT